MAVGLVGAHRERRIQQEDTTISPGCEQATLAWWGFECGGEVVLETGVDVLEGWWGWGWWSHGEGKAMCLVDVVVRVLSEYDDFDVWERCVSRPERRGKKKEREIKVLVYVPEGEKYLAACFTMYAQLHLTMSTHPPSVGIPSCRFQALS